MIQPPADVPSPRRVLLPLGLAVALSLLGDLSLFIALAPQATILSLTLAQVGILLSVHRLIRISGNPIVGILLDRFGRRPLFLLGLLLAVFSTTLYGVISGFWLFLLARLMWGCAWALINVSALTMILDLSKQNDRGRLTGTYNAWTWAGYALGPLAGGLLVDHLTFRPAMLLCACASAVGLFVAVARMPETRPTLVAPPTLGLGRGLAALAREWLSAVSGSRPIQLSLLLFVITQFAGDGIVLSSVALLLTERFPGGLFLGPFSLGIASAGGVLLMIRSILAGSLGLAVGNLSDRRWGRLPWIALGLLAGIAAFLLLVAARSASGVVLAVALSAVSGGSIVTLLPAYVGDHTPPGSQGAVMGAFATAGDCGSTLGPFLAYSLAPLFGLAGVYLLAVGLFAVGLLALARQLAEERR